jgi:DMSO/TMAO reductase YedYZ heme-binding membrane subunit
MAAQQRGLWEGWRVWAILSGLVAVVTMAILVPMGFSVPGIHASVRVTARTSELLFVSAFTASALLRLWPGAATRWMVRNRRWLGLSFATSHAIHAVLFITFWRLAPQQFDELVNVGTRYFAGGAYVFIALMAATSFDGAVKWLGAKRWKVLHTFGGYYIWATFMGSAAKRIPTMPLYVLPLILLLIVLALRLTVLVRKTPVRAGAA